MSDSPLKILVVDNHPLFLQSISAILHSSEYDVKTAEGGLEAIDIIKTFKPHIFFVDLVMPYISGEKLCSYIRSQNGFEKAFVVILSGIASESEILTIPDEADAFIAKGPMKKMAEHIFEVIDLFRNRDHKELPDSLLGLEEIHPRHITKELLFSVKHLEVLLENMSEAVIEVSTDNRIVYMNPSASRILEEGEFSILSKNLDDAFSIDHEDELFHAMADFDSGKTVKDKVIQLNSRYVKVSILKISDSEVEAKLIILNDVTSFKEKEESLQRALKEKEMLIREIHHRVKNNLNIISGLMSIQSMMVEDETIRDMILEVQPRLQSISLVHDKLYNSENLTNVNLGLYLEELADLLLGMLSDNTLHVKVDVTVPPIILGTDMTVALGLICTEMITNAVKYGFSRKEKNNELKIRMEIMDYENILYISNNGAPFPEDVDIYNTKSLGFQVINLLVEQLKGSFRLIPGKDVCFAVTFPRL